MTRQPIIRQDDVHRYDVDRIRPVDPAAPDAWRATCSCGWLSRDHRTFRDADDDAVEHVVASVRFE